LYPVREGAILRLSGPLTSLGSQCCAALRSKRSITSTAGLRRPAAMLRTVCGKLHCPLVKKIRSLRCGFSSKFFDDLAHCDECRLAYRCWCMFVARLYRRWWVLYLRERLVSGLSNLLPASASRATASSSSKVRCSYATRNLTSAYHGSRTVVHFITVSYWRHLYIIMPPRMP